MEGVTDKLINYQQIVQQLLTGYAEVKPAYGDLEVETIFDTQRDRYQIVHLGWQHKRWVHHCVIHLDIRNEKIWIFYNSTEHDIAADLVDLGVPKQDIVLGFHPPFMREMSDYAVG
ncbi:MAG: XisI protein [Oscillatoria sp. PMC 1051.18]|uniref:XisI protein n=1 Tax=Oscillatoria salina TaxID=331517 RepID=UPI0013BB8C27|nr:XisI protein [Oscillatoria salina]MBZ8181323.1 XisI protein [Oscillatoria salina IIICB1]MEC4896034.1 XisI protein [Oscillatoria sp. PMC 1050.18]MEC5032966.1 XisI protein [Oscillatoria sp. PMC 1051.18]NET87807.1 XisI protein [Kamptonema sp. SIO1D9]